MFLVNRDCSATKLICGLSSGPARSADTCQRKYPCRVIERRSQKGGREVIKLMKNDGRRQVNEGGSDNVHIVLSKESSKTLGAGCASHGIKSPAPKPVLGIIRSPYEPKDNEIIRF